MCSNQASATTAVNILIMQLSCSITVPCGSKVAAGATTEVIRMLSAEMPTSVASAGDSYTVTELQRSIVTTQQYASAVVILNAYVINALCDSLK
jgi:hypothetical protein